MFDRGRGRGRARGRGFGRGGRGNQSVQPNRRYESHNATNHNGEMNAHLSERFKGRSRQLDNDNGTNSKDSDFNLVLNPEIAKYVQNQNAIGWAAGHDDWLSLPEIPPSSEILVPEGESIVLPRNRIDQPWTKKERYLKAHYKLLREDAVAPLREAVTKFRKDPLRMGDNDTRIYEDVRVVGLTFTSKGIASRVRFSTARSCRKILWSSSKRLTSGTLVALTPTQDAFKTSCFLATVAARPLENLENDAPEVDLFFSDHNTHDIDPQNTYFMIEATQGYYEAYRHTLKALQKQSKEIFPLSEHICQLQPDVGPPQYLRLKPERDMTPAADDATRDAFQRVDLLEDWPATPSSSLDKSQWNAMKEILTKKLAIIQGPPGTGKTHVSKIALEILLRNRSSIDPPIIVACQTNHALDQLLVLIHAFEPTFIRLGGRSVSTTVKPRALHEVRKAQVYDDIPGSCFSKARRDLNTQTIKLKSLLSPVRSDAQGPVIAEVLFNLGVISEQQRKSLEKGAESWVHSDATLDDPLQMWLGKAVTPYIPFYSKDSFGFEEAEEDLEAEQLKELEAEQGIVDEEDTEMLKGEYLALNMGYTIAKPTPQTIDHAKRMLDTAVDLYRVPDHLKGAMYILMQARAREIVRHRLREGAQEYARISSQFQVGRWEKDVAYLAQAPIIGMTTTGLSKYRALVSALKPKIVLIEEAAEVLEAPVGVACVESVEHLVLVGDHQQLQAHCSVKELEGEPYFLNISMFERLVRNGIPHKTLLRQRRMEPEFRELIQPIYPELRDHESIVSRQRIEWGTGDVRSWFFNHDNMELQDETMSTFNEFEARLISKFYRHLIRNRVPAAAITVLTFYNGQRKKILRALKDDPETASVYNKVKTVDSYQGEENHIVILSLVRNNLSGKIGFLDINNRVVVALSRAKYGFYIFGNGGFLSEHNEIWSFVEDHMWRQGRSRNEIPLRCTNHGNVVWVKYPEDFEELNGGCKERCGGSLDCGHPCPLRCHPSPHSWITCQRPCHKELVCGHFCTKQCHELCGCDCETYQRHEEEAAGGPFPDNTPQWQALAQNRLTEANVSKLTDANLKIVSDIPKINTEEAGKSKPVPEERKRDIANGRTRYEQHWQAENPQRSTAEIPVQPIADMNVHSETRESVKEGKKRERPAPQVRDAGRLGLDGTNEQIDIADINAEIPRAEYDVGWDAETTKPTPQATSMSEWIDEEYQAEMKLQEEQRKEFGDAFW